MTAQAQHINFGEDDHTTVIGRTRSGKTTGARLSLEKSRRGVLFFNTQQIRFPGAWTAANINTDFEDILDELIGDGKIVYNPSREFRQQEITFLIGLLYKAAETHGSALNIYLVVDEVHLYRGKALQACIEVATTGIRWGIKAVWISQRPAKIDNTLMTQSTRFVVYDLSHMEADYLKNHQMPYKEIFDRLRAGGQFSYVIYDGHEITGAYKVSM